MTLSELKGLRYLILEINHQQDRIAELRSQAERITPILSSMPKGTDMHDKISEIVASIADLEQEMALTIGELIKQRKRIEKWINDIDDPEVRTTMRMRFVDGKTLLHISEYFGVALPTPWYWIENALKRCK